MIDSDIVVGTNPLDNDEPLAGTGLKVTVTKEELAQRLALVSRAVSTRTAVLVLGGIRLRAEAGRLHLAATDMELSLRASLEATVDGEGEVVVPGRLLLDIARSLPGDDVSITHRPEEAAVAVTSGTASYRLHTYSAEDFPRLPEVETAQLHAIEREALVETIARVGRSASRDESRPVLTGILVRFEPGKMVMAATDSYRLAVKETPVNGELPDLEAIIPARALQELARIAGAGDEVQLGLLENHVVFGTDGTWLTTRRIDDGELTVSAVTQDVGESRESLPASFSADAMEIGFNADFLRDGLESVDADTLKLKLISPLRPAVLEGEADDYTYLIMPIRLAG